MDVTDQFEDRADLLQALKGYLEELRDTGVEELEFAEVGAALPAERATQSAPHAGAAAGAPDTPPADAAVAQPVATPAAGQDQELCRSYGDPHARVLFLMNGPGFAGAAGELLQKIVQAMGFQSGQVHLLCFSQPPTERATMLREELLSRVAQVAPEVVIALGEPAAHLLLAKHQPLAALRGKFHRLAATKVAVTEDPQALVDDPSLKREVWSEMQRVMAHLGQPPQ